jgi:hypothetical protein
MRSCIQTSVENDVCYTFRDISYKNNRHKKSESGSTFIPTNENAIITGMINCLFNIPSLLHSVDNTVDTLNTDSQ